EPDIYLHSDLQRQLLGILKELGPDIVIATHSTEIITEADVSDILIINKSHLSAKRIKDAAQLREIFNVLGSNLNPILTQIAKTKRVLFVEGKDFAVLSKIARALNFKELANRTDFAVVPVEGFNPVKLKAFKEGIEKTIGSAIVSAVIFDRDYKSDKEIKAELLELEKGNNYAHIHSFKELENIMLIPIAIDLAIKQKLQDYNKRTGENISFSEDIISLLLRLSDEFKSEVQAQLQSHRLKYERLFNRGVDDSVILREIIKEFDDSWGDLNSRLKIISGKEFISRLNTHLQETYLINITIPGIINNIDKGLVTEEILNLMKNLNDFRQFNIT
ncbi:MAG TPA: hypothetical protein VNX40_15800, partial [Mucilaginibacter sp.]|nr:hypothetical protein [Mucilaginibacter sp.]